MLQFRAMQDGDLDALTRIVERVWKMDSMCGGHTIGWHMAREYLLNTLSHSTSVQVALWMQKIAGFLAIDDKFCLNPIRLGKVEFPQKLHTKAVEVMRTRMAEYDQLCAKLLKESGRQFDGEVTLFAVEPSLQGKGIGTALFEKAQAYFAHKNFYIPIQDAIIHFMIPTECTAWQNRKIRIHIKKTNHFISSYMRQPSPKHRMIRILPGTMPD